MDLMTLLPQMGGLIWTVLAFIVALSVIVAVHEYGHYIVGRWCGIKADVFSLGFGPVIWSRPDRHGTQWQIAALPFGGYVKFRGDANAASVGQDGTAATLSPKERASTMHGAALWRRTATVMAGPVFNFILSSLIFAAFLVFVGQAREAAIVGPLKTLPSDLETLRPGDEILEFNGVPVTALSQLIEEAAEQPAAPVARYVVRRDGAEIVTEAAWPMLAVVEDLQPRSAAIDAGLRVGDVIRAINGQPINAFEELRQTVLNSDGAALDLSVWRAGEMLALTLSPRRVDVPLPEGGFETRWLIGITGGLFFEPEKERLGPFAALQSGVAQTGYVITSSLSGLWHMVSGQISTCNMSGPIGIAEASGDTASVGVGNFIWFIAVLSTAVGMLNLFPIPMLDGGHLVFYAYEAVMRRPPSPKAINALMIFGITLMACIMLFALSRDLFC